MSSASSNANPYEAGLVLTYPASATSLQTPIGLTVLPSGVDVPGREFMLGMSYGLVVVTSSHSCGLLVCAGQPTFEHLFQTSDQKGLPIFWSGLLNGSAAGWYASLGSYSDNLHQLGWYNDPSGGDGTHGYSFINKWGSAPFDIGAAATFHGNPIRIEPLQIPTLLAQTSPLSSRVFRVTPDMDSFTLTINGEETEPISATANLAQIQDKVQALPGPAGVEASVTWTGEWPASVTVPDGLGDVTALGANIDKTPPLEEATTYYYVATAVALDETETVRGAQVSYTPTNASPTVKLVVTQDWGMKCAKIYRSTTDGGPYNLVAILPPDNPAFYDDLLHTGISLVDSGLIPTNDEAPEEPAPPPTVWRAWLGEHSDNVKLEGQDFCGSTQWSITAGGQFAGSNVGSALKTSPLYSRRHSLTPSTTAGERGQPFTFSPDAGFSCIFPFAPSSIIGRSSGMRDEELTLELNANYSDSTSCAETITFAHDATSEMRPIAFSNLIKSAVTITSFDASVMSSRDGSDASVSVTIVGTNGL